MRSLLRNTYELTLEHKLDYSLNRKKDKDGNFTGEVEASYSNYRFRAPVEPRNSVAHDEYFAKDLDYNYVIVLGRGTIKDLWDRPVLAEMLLSPGDRITVWWRGVSHMSVMEVTGVSFTKNVIRIAIKSLLKKGITS